MPSLTSIPLELLVQISAYLTTPDLGSLRRTCRVIEKSLYQWFAQEFFTKKQFMLSPPSLQALVDISKHAAFSKQLKHVIIATDRFDDTNLRFNDRDASVRYRQGYADQFIFTNTGMDREMLTDAFQRLPNLEVVGMRDFNARSRERDGNAFWTSYGATTVFQETGLRLQTAPGMGPYGGREDLQAFFVAHVFSTILYALGKAGRAPPAFEIILRQPNSGLPDYAFNIPDVAISTVDGVLRGLKSILLTLSLQSKPAYRYVGQSIDEICAGLFLRRFLARIPNITHLRLNFQKHQQVECQDFLRWLGQSGQPASSTEPAPVELPHLEAIDFGMLHTSPDILQAILTKFAPIKRLSLWKVGFTSTDRVPTSNARRGLWSVFLSKLASVPQIEQSLEHIMIGMVSEQYGLSSAQLQVDFEMVSDQKSQTIEYVPKGDKGLEALASCVRVQWPPEEESENSDEEMLDEAEDVLDEEGEDEGEDEDEEDAEEVEE